MDKDALNRLAGAVSELRGMKSQRDFAAEMGVAQSTIAGWEGGKNTPNLDNIEKLANRRGQLPEEFVAYLYGRDLASSLPIDEQIKRMPRRKLLQLQRTIIDQLLEEER